MIATNAGGHQVLRFGMMREQMLGVEAVLADGTIISAMNGLIKNNTGYDLKQRIAGSEHTLAVVTRAVLRLRPQAIVRETALCGFASHEQVARTLGRLEQLLPAQLTVFDTGSVVDYSNSLLRRAAGFCYASPGTVPERNAETIWRQARHDDWERR
jgi:FAD/FMN-containing dehydrogenase